MDEWVDGEECPTCNAWGNKSGGKEAGYLEKAKDPVLDWSLMRSVDEVEKKP